MVAVRDALMDAVCRRLREGNYRPSEAEILRVADATADDLAREFGSLERLLQHFARTRHEDVLRYAIRDVPRIAIKDENSARALAWVLLTGRRWRSVDQWAD